MFPKWCKGGGVTQFGPCSQILHIFFFGIFPKEILYETKILLKNWFPDPLFPFQNPFETLLGSWAGCLFPHGSMGIPRSARMFHPALNDNLIVSPWLASVHPWLAIQLDYGYDGELSWLFKFVLFQDWWAESFFANHFISQISFDLHRTCIARWNIPINCIKALLIQNHLGHFIPCSICIDVSIRRKTWKRKVQNGGKSKIQKQFFNQ